MPIMVWLSIEQYDYELFFSDSTCSVYEEHMKKKKIKQLRFIASTKEVDISSCLEKSEIVDKILHCLKKEACSGFVKTNRTIERVTIKSDASVEYKELSDFDFLSEESLHDDDKNKERKRRAHRKTKDLSWQKCNLSLWQNVNVSFVEQLPFDIDGLVIYRLTFDPNKSYA